MRNAPAIRHARLDISDATRLIFALNLTGFVMVIMIVEIILMRAMLPARRDRARATVSVVRITTDASPEHGIVMVMTIVEMVWTRNLICVCVNEHAYGKCIFLFNCRS